jgi:hypothetical protein
MAWGLSAVRTPGGVCGGDALEVANQDGELDLLRVVDQQARPDGHEDGERLAVLVKPG